MFCSISLHVTNLHLHGFQAQGSRVGNRSPMEAWPGQRTPRMVKKYAHERQQSNEGSFSMSRAKGVFMPSGTQVPLLKLKWGKKSINI